MVRGRVGYQTWHSSALVIVGVPQGSLALGSQVFGQASMETYLFWPKGYFNQLSLCYQSNTKTTPKNWLTRVF